ncbi:MAG: type II toxin-antitoxin system RelE/ParE family toxin [Bacteroidota bacterium]
MNVEFTRRFQKEFYQRSKNNNLANLLDDVIENVISAQEASEIKKLKKLQGFKEYYRIRLGVFRIGVKIERETVIFAAFDHRKDIYKNFP